MNGKIAKLKEIIGKSSNMAFFGGAGVSTESGIPDFRSVDGLYSQRYKYPPETMLSRTFFDARPEEFFKFYKDKVLFLGASPNAAHLALAELERRGILKAVITQNIDGLHTAAGSKNVLELHGSVHRNYCQGCGRFYGADFIKGSAGVPKCPCGGVVKPDIVLYEEGLDSETLSLSAQFISEADLLVVGGTSLVVYPAAGLLKYFVGNNIILINKTETAFDSQASLVINESIGHVLKEVL
jgi:NAD-dependent deacetylase